MSKFIDYYEKYHEVHGNKGYTMAATKDTSRVLTLQRWVKEHVKPGAKILDVGCGDCYLSRTLQDYLFTNIDIATNAPGAADVQKVDLDSPPFPFKPGSFDAVVCSEVLEHLFDLPRIQQEIRRIIKPGGWYLLSTPNHDWMDNKLEGYSRLLFDHSQTHLMEHIRFYNAQVHAKYLVHAGFTVEEITGGDAHFGNFFSQPRYELKDAFGDTKTQQEVDEILGRMFPLTSHTIILRAKAV